MIYGGRKRDIDFREGEKSGCQSKLLDNHSELSLMKHEQSKCDSNPMMNFFSEHMSPESKEAMTAELKNYYLSGINTNMLHKPIIKYDDIPNAIPYQEFTAYLKTCVHVGRRKMFLNEVQFLSKIKGSATVIYAGAAPANRCALLAYLFSNIKFILVDPNPFNVIPLKLAIGCNDSTSEPYLPYRWSNYRQRLDEDTADKICQDISTSPHNINIINDYMTVSLAQSLHKYINTFVYFISDIRTKVEEIPDTNDILWNNAQQLNWIRVLKPIKSMLKFRHPHYGGTALNESWNEFIKHEPQRTDFELAKTHGIDFDKNFKERVMTYFDGDIYIQPWPGSSSTESRLVTDGLKFRNYGTNDEYNNKYFWYNLIARNYILFENDNACKKIGFDHCADCAIENHVWKQYIKTQHAPLKVLDLVRLLNHATHRGLIRDYHDKLFALPPSSAVL
jgi:hypothetical protein